MTDLLQTPSVLRRVQRNATSATPSPLADSREDALAFDHFYVALSAKILDFFERRTWNWQVSLDLTAETFAKAFEKRGDFAGRSPEQAAGWLWAIARNELGAYWREQRVMSRAIDRFGVDRPQLVEEEIHRVEERVAAAAVHGELKAGLIALSLDQRRAIGMRLLQELDYEEIAGQLGVTQQVARARVSRGLRMLRRSLTCELRPLAAEQEEGNLTVRG